MSNILDAVVVGAGPYGLSIAAHLRGRGLKFRIFGELMHSWAQRMPAGMDLKSDGFASNISDPHGRFSLAAYCAEMGLPYQFAGLPVTLETFIAYGRWFQERAVPDLDPRAVTAIAPTTGGYLVTVSGGEQLTARNVIVAVGITHFQHIPEMLAGLAPGSVSHSAQHPDPKAFKDREVTILGRGASALDLAMLIHEAGGKVRVVARKPRIDFHDKAKFPRPLFDRLRRPMSRLGAGWRNLVWSDFPLVFSCLPEATRIEIARTFLGPAPGWSVRPRVEGKFPMLLGYEVESAAMDGGKVKLQLKGANGARETVVTEHLVAATGYKADIGRLTFLSPGLRQSIKTIGGAPVVSRRFESSAKGLYFAGLAAANTFGPVMRFAAGAPFTAARLAGSIRNETGSSDQLSASEPALKQAASVSTQGR